MEAGGRPGAIFGKEFGSSSSKSVRKVRARRDGQPRGVPLPRPPFPPWATPCFGAAPPRVYSWTEKGRKKTPLPAPAGATSPRSLPIHDSLGLAAVLPLNGLKAPEEALTLCQRDLLVLP